MSTYAIEFKETEPNKIQNLLNFVRSLDFVASVEPSSESMSDDEKIQTNISNHQLGYLPIDEIKIAFPNQWVLLSDFNKIETTILGGIVLCNDVDKREFALKAREFVKNNKNVAHLYTGVFPRIARSGLMRKIKV
jgi:hypothetical protein